MILAMSHPSLPTAISSAEVTLVPTTSAMTTAMATATPTATTMITSLTQAKMI